MRAKLAKPRTWQIRRELVGCPDGQRRWDRAYQLLLHWAVAPPKEGTWPFTAPELGRNQE